MRPGTPLRRSRKGAESPCQRPGGQCAREKYSPQGDDFVVASIFQRRCAAYEISPRKFADPVGGRASPSKVGGAAVSTPLRGFRNRIAQARRRSRRACATPSEASEGRERRWRHHAPVSNIPKTATCRTEGALPLRQVKRRRSRPFGLRDPRVKAAQRPNAGSATKAAPATNSGLNQPGEHLRLCH